MKKTIIFIFALFAFSTTFFAQEQNRKEGNKKRFSLEEFQNHQREFITNHARLTPEEAEAFFPIFFELQKKKWLINKEARDKVDSKYGKEHSEEKSLLIVNELADAKIKIAELEKEYIEKYLKAIPAKKILGVQRAEDNFQKDMLKRMWDRGGRNHRNSHRK